jgi:hypothetical protein
VKVSELVHRPCARAWRFYAKSFLTIWVGRTYTTAIDGVAADFAAGADASPFEPDGSAGSVSQGVIVRLIWLGALAFGL